jgi:hypothetical protein
MIHQRENRRPPYGIDGRWAFLLRRWGAYRSFLGLRSTSHDNVRDGFDESRLYFDEFVGEKLM